MGRSRPWLWLSTLTRWRRGRNLALPWYLGSQRSFTVLLDHMEDNRRSAISHDASACPQPLITLRRYLRSTRPSTCHCSCRSQPATTSAQYGRGRSRNEALESSEGIVPLKLPGPFPRWSPPRRPWSCSPVSGVAFTSLVAVFIRLLKPETSVWASSHFRSSFAWRSRSIWRSDRDP